jgi:hypothetical protein
LSASCKNSIGTSQKTDTTIKGSIDWLGPHSRAITFLMEF